MQYPAVMSWSCDFRNCSCFQGAIETPANYELVTLDYFHFVFTFKLTFHRSNDFWHFKWNMNESWFNRGQQNQVNENHSLYALKRHEDILRVQNNARKLFKVSLSIRLCILFFFSLARKQSSQIQIKHVTFETIFPWKGIAMRAHSSYVAT